MVSDSTLLSDLRRRIKQQNDSVNNPFVRNTEELLNFFCENNTQLSWSDIDEQLIDYADSRTQIPGVEVDHLVEALDESNPNNNSRKGKGGQHSIVSKFPQIADEVSEFIKQHGFSAQSRRRAETGYSSGVTAKQIQQHFHDTYPELKEH